MGEEVVEVEEAVVDSEHVVEEVVEVMDELELGLATLFNFLELGLAGSHPENNKADKARQRGTNIR